MCRLPLADAGPVPVPELDVARSVAVICPVPGCDPSVGLRAAAEDPARHEEKEIGWLNTSLPCAPSTMVSHPP